MYSLGAVLFHMYFPDHPTGPLPVGNGRTSTGVGVVGVPLALPREMDHATASLLRALLAADPAERPTAPDALQVSDYAALLLFLPCVHGLVLSSVAAIVPET